MIWCRSRKRDKEVDIAGDEEAKVNTKSMSDKCRMALLQDESSNGSLGALIEELINVY